MLGRCETTSVVGEAGVVIDARDASEDGSETSFHPFDLSDASNAISHDTNNATRDSVPGLIGHAQSVTGTALALWVRGSHVYVGDWGLAPLGNSSRGNLQRYDVSDPSHPVLKDSLYLCDTYCEIGDITGDGSRLFVASNMLGVLVFNLLDSGETSLSNRLISRTATGGGAALVAVTSLSGSAVSTFLLAGKHSSVNLEMYDITTSSILTNPIPYPLLSGNADSLFAMDVRGPLGYLLSDTVRAEFKFEIVDLSPLPGGDTIQLAEIAWSKATDGYNGRIKVQGDFAYVAASASDPNNSQPSSVSGGLRVIDVSNPSNPFIMGKGLDLPSVGHILWSGAGLDVDGTSVYFVTEEGLYVIDVTNPKNPQIAAFHSFPKDFLPCLGGRAWAQGPLVYVTAYCQSEDGLQGRGGLAIYRVR